MTTRVKFTIHESQGWVTAEGLENQLLSFMEGDASLTIIRLSEYYHGDGDDDEEEENFSFAADEDLPLAEEIAEILTNELGATFAFEASFEEW